MQKFVFLLAHRVGVILHPSLNRSRHAECVRSRRRGRGGCCYPGAKAAGATHWQPSAAGVAGRTGRAYADRRRRQRQDGSTHDRGFRLRDRQPGRGRRGRRELWRPAGAGVSEVVADLLLPGDGPGDGRAVRQPERRGSASTRSTFRPARASSKTWTRFRRSSWPGSSFATSAADARPSWPATATASCRVMAISPSGAMVERLARDRLHGGHVSLELLNPHLQQVSGDRVADVG